jgi:glutathione synthase/RimK-type ligase-like ATP-grasp enzyme
MLLILTNSEDVTADYLSKILNECRTPFLRVDTDTILDSVSFSYDGREALLRLSGKSYRPQDFSNVWYRRPELLKSRNFNGTPEGRFVIEEWSEALEAFFSRIDSSKWMNHPAHNVGASHKIEQLTTATALGLRIPETLVTQDPNELRRFYSEHNGRVIVKPMATGHVERCGRDRDSVIYTNPVVQEHLADLLDLSNCPTLFQERIDKVSDVRITIVDHDIHAVELTAQDADGTQRCDIRRNNMDDVKYRAISVPDAVRRALIALIDRYSLRFAAIDMAVTHKHEWIFFEVNPNGQWAWLDLVAGMNIALSFIKAFK